MELQNAIKTAFERIKDVLAFLDKVKVDKKLRKEKEELLVALRVYMEVNQKHLPPEEEEYVDTAVGNVEHPENYDDVELKGDATGDVYEDTATHLEPDDVYEDASVDTAPVTKQSPSHTTILPIACEKLTGASFFEFLEIKREEKMKIRSPWLKRWCVVQRNIFYVYESSSDKKQKDAFELNNCVVNIRDNISKETKRKDRCFEVKTNSGKTYEFCASDKESAVKWKACLEQASTANPMSRNELPLPESPATNVSPSHSKIKLNIFGKKKKKNKDTSDTISTVSEDDLYQDTAGEPPQHDAATDDMLYMDTENHSGPEEGDIYNDVADTPEVKPPLPAPGIRGRKSSAAGMQLPPTPGGGFPAPPAEDFNTDPIAPPRPKKTAKNEALPPPPPPGDRDTGSASGVFSHRLPPIPQDQEAPQTNLPLPPPIINNLGAVNGLPDDEDEEYKETNISELYQGMWDCPADENNELPFKRGQIVHIISKEYDQYGWWIAKRRDEVGFVPKDYLMQAYEI